MLNRREILAGGLALATLGASSARAAASGVFSKADYTRAIVIDGQGAIADPYGKPEDPHFSACALAEIRPCPADTDVPSRQGDWPVTPAGLTRTGTRIAGTAVIDSPGHSTEGR
jgi:hypothetical protein